MGKVDAECPKQNYIKACRRPRTSIATISGRSPSKTLWVVTPHDSSYDEGVQSVFHLRFAAGRTITKNSFNGISPPAPSRDTAAIQERPTNLKTWNLWKSALAMLVHTRKVCVLLRPLGDWLHDHQHLKRQWPALYHATLCQVFVAVSPTIYLVCPPQRQNSANFYETDQHSTYIPEDSVPFDITQENNVLKKSRTWSIMPAAPSEEESMSSWRCSLARTMAKGPSSPYLTDDHTP
jgi:hypothetical protein